MRFLIFKLKSPGLTVGRNVYAGRNCAISAVYGLSIGNNVYIGKNVTIEVQGAIGQGCLIANNVGIVGRTDHDLHFPGDIFFAKTVREEKKLSRPVYLENGVWLGYGVIVLSGVRIGAGSVVAAGSVVIHDIPSGSIAAGNPARVIGQRFTALTPPA